MSKMQWAIMLYIYVPCTEAVSLVFLNFAVQPVNNTIFCLDDVMDALFDIQYFECDPLTRQDQDTPLHVAVRFANEKDSNLGLEMIEMMCEAGCDPRVRNKHGQKPVDLVYGDHKDIKAALQKAEYILNENIQVDEEEGAGGDAGSASDSD